MHETIVETYQHDWSACSGENLTLHLAVIRSRTSLAWGGGCRVGFRGTVRLGGVPVRITPIVRLIESAAAKHNGSTAADQSTEFVLTALRTLLKRSILDVLKLFKFVGTSITMVIVGRHGKQGVMGKWLINCPHYNHKLMKRGAGTFTLTRPNRA